MHSDKKKYLEELERELKDLPLKDRLIQELKDHIEDLSETQSQPLNFKHMNHQIGEPKSIKKTYHSILNPLRGLYFLMEGLFFGLLLLPLGFVSFLLFGRLGVETLLLPLLLGIVPFIALYFIAFAFAFNRWRKLTQTTGYPLWMWIVLIMTPSVVIFGSTAFSLLKTFFECPTCNENPIKDLVSILGTVFVLMGALAISGHLAWKKSKLRLPKIEKIGFAIGLYLLAFGLIRTGSTYLESPMLSFLTAPFTPIALLEYMLMIFGTFLFSGAGNLVNGNLTILILGLALFLLIVQFLVDTVRAKKVSWLRLGIAFCALSVFFVNPQFYGPSMDWQKPIETISEKIEKKQHGLFYGLLKYTNQDEGRLYRYRVEWGSGEFLVTQNSGKVFSVLSNELSEVNSVAHFPEAQMTFPEDLTCFSGEGPDMEIILNADFYYCTRLVWKGEEVWTSEPWSIITDLALSDDQKWLMLVVQNGAYDPEYVYLVELEKSKDPINPPNSLESTTQFLLGLTNGTATSWIEGIF